MTSSWVPLRLRTTRSHASLIFSAYPVIPDSQRLKHLRFLGTTVRPSSSHPALRVSNKSATTCKTLRETRKKKEILASTLAARTSAAGSLHRGNCNGGRVLASSFCRWWLSRC